MSILPKARNENLVVQEVGDEVLVYDLANNKAVCLNDTAATVWKLSDGLKTVPEIAKELCDKFKKPVRDDLVWLAIEQLKEEGLLADSDQLRTRFKGLTRREIVKRIGTASMVALPIISAIVAPASASAQTGSFACAVGTCIPAGTFVCPPCTGMSITLDQFSSTDGSCTGTVTPNAVFVACGLGAGFPTGDLQIVMIS